jgi:hypothetical protein
MVVILVAFGLILVGIMKFFQLQVLFIILPGVKIALHVLMLPLVSILGIMKSMPIYLRMANGYVTITDVGMISFYNK